MVVGRVGVLVVSVGALGRGVALSVVVRGAKTVVGVTLSGRWHDMVDCFCHSRSELAVDRVGVARLG